MTEASRPTTGGFRGAGGTVRLRPGALSWREVMGEVIALDSVSRRYFTVNSTGQLVWELLTAGATLDQLEERIVAAHPEARDRARADVEAFVAVLHDRGLIDVETPTQTERA